MTSRDADERAGKGELGDERHAAVDCPAADAIAVGPSLLIVFARHVDDEVHAPRFDKLLGATGLVHLGAGDADRREHFGGAARTTGPSESSTPLRGSRTPVAASACRSRPRQPTSPVESISTPSIGSAPFRRAKENIGALTPT